MIHPAMATGFSGDFICKLGPALTEMVLIAMLAWLCEVNCRRIVRDPSDLGMSIRSSLAIRLRHPHVLLKQRQLRLLA